MPENTIFRTKSGMVLLRQGQKYYLIENPGAFLAQAGPSVTLPEIKTMVSQGILRAVQVAAGAVEVQPNVWQRMNAWTLEGLRQQVQAGGILPEEAEPEPFSQEWVRQQAAKAPAEEVVQAGPSQGIQAEGAPRQDFSWPTVKERLGGAPVTGQLEGVPEGVAKLDPGQDYPMDVLLAADPADAKAWWEARSASQGSQWVIAQMQIPGSDRFADHIQNVPVAGWDPSWPTTDDLRQMGAEEARQWLRDFQATDVEGFKQYREALSQQDWVDRTVGDLFGQEQAKVGVRGVDELDRLVHKITPGYPPAIRNTVKALLGGTLVGVNFEGDIERQWRNYQLAWEDATDTQIPETEYGTVFKQWFERYEPPPTVLDEAWNAYATADPRFAMSAPIVKTVANATGQTEADLYSQIYQEALKSSPEYEQSLKQARDVAERQLGVEMEPFNQMDVERLAQKMVMQMDIDIPLERFANTTSDWGRVAYQSLPENQRVPMELLPPGFFSPQGQVEIGPGAAALEAARQATPEAMEQKAYQSYTAWVSANFGTPEERMRLEPYFTNAYQDYQNVVRQRGAMPFESYLQGELGTEFFKKFLPAPPESPKPKPQRFIGVRFS